jgi:hypothetical protein
VTAGGSKVLASKGNGSGPELGLDTFVSRSPGDPVLSDDDAATFGASGINLCGGVFSDGVTSIRGKVYAELVLEVTGISLYQEWIPPEDVLSMSGALDARSAEHLAHLWDRIDPRGRPAHATAETAGLKRFTRICAERGLGLIGWW